MESIADFAERPQPFCHQDADPAGLAEPLVQRNLAWEPHQASYQGQAAVDIQIQADRRKFHKQEHKFLKQMYKYYYID